MKQKLLFIAAFIFALFSYGKAETTTPKLSIGFIKNVGQFTEQAATKFGIKYVYQGKAQTLQLRASGFNYLIQTKNIDLSQSSKIIGQNIQIQFLGSNPNAQIIELEKGEGELIYHSKEKFSDTYYSKHFREVIFRNIYPNIDIQYLISENEQGKEQFKYNFILHPGSRVEDIQMEIDGAKSTGVNLRGSLCIYTAMGRIQERIPASYELNQDGSKGKAFKAKYNKLRENVFGFKTNAKVMDKTLVIDPISWCTYIGGSVVDIGYAVANDKSSNVYIAGITTSSSGFASTGAYQVTLGGAYDAFLTKFSSSGAMLWTTYFGGANDERVTDISMDNAGNILISGFTSSPTGISNGNALQPALAGLRDGFVAKFNPSGGNIWATYYGFSGDDYFYGISVDKDNDVYLCGKSNSTNMLSSGVHQAANAGIYDALIMKMSSLGAYVYSSYFGGSLNEEAMAICVDGNKNIFITGESASTSGIASNGSYQTTLSGQMDIFLARFDSTCNLKFATYYGGIQNDYGSDMTIDVEGKIVIVGHTSSSTKIATSGAQQSTYLGNPNDGYVLRIDTLGNPIWATYAGGDGQDYIYGVSTDQFANIYITGTTGSSNNISTPGAPQELFGGASQDASLMKFDKTGTKTWGTYIGGTNGDIGFALSSDGANGIYLLGQTLSANNIATIGAFHTTLSGSTDAFLYKYSDVAPTVISNNTISPNQGLCLGNVAQTLIGSSPSGGNGSYSYKWLSSTSGVAGSFVAASGTNININYSPGLLTQNYYYKRVVYSGTQTDTSAALSILVSSGGVQAGFVVNKSIQCLRNNQFIFTDTTNTGLGTLSYWWDFGNGKTSNNNPDTVHYDVAVNNMYRVRLITLLNGGCGDTNYLNVYTINDPILNTLIGKDSVMRNTNEIYSVLPTVGSSFQWIFDKGTGRSTSNSINIKWTQIGDAQLKLVETNGGGCVGDTLAKNIYIKPATGIEDLNLEYWTIYPNPSNGILQIEGDGIPISIRVTSMTGQLELEWVQTKSKVFDLSSLKAGIYLLEVTNESGSVYFQKVAKQ